MLQAPQQRRGRLARARLKHGLVLVPRVLACLRLAGGAREGVSQLARADGGRGRCVFRVARPSRAGGVLADDGASSYSSGYETVYRIWRVG